MQEEVNERTVAISVKAAKLTGRVLTAAFQTVLKRAKNQQQKAQTPQGRQSVKKLMNHYGAKNAMQLVGAPRQFDQVARKWGVDYAFHKTGPGHYLLFFKAGQADAITAAFAEYTKRTLNKDKEKPSIISQLQKLTELARAQPQLQRIRKAVRKER